MTTSRRGEKPHFASRDGACKWIREVLGAALVREVQFICSAETPRETLCLIKTDPMARADVCMSVGGQTFGDDVMVFLPLTPIYSCPLRTSEGVRLAPVCSCRPDLSGFP